jgi:hypothetical protein
LTASAADEAAQESDRIGAGFFSHYLLSGLRGAADTNRDKLVTLAEAYQFSYHETLRGTGKAAQSQHPAYDFQLAGQGDLVLTDLRASGATLVLTDALVGRVFVRDQSGRLLAELRKGHGYPVQLGLGPGRYEVSLERDGGLYQASVTLHTGNATSLGPGAFRTRAVERAGAKGVIASDLPPGERSLGDALIGRDSLAGQTREVGGYASLGFRYTRLGGEDALLVSPEIAVLLNRRVTLGFSAGGGASGATDSAGNRMSLGFAGAVVRYQFLFDGPFSFSLGAIAGAGGVDLERENERAEGTADALFLFEPQLGGHISVTRFLRFGVDAGYRLVAGVERYPVSDVRDLTAGFHMQAGWF